MVYELGERFVKQVTRLARFRCSPALLLGFVLCTGSVLSVAAASAQQPQPPQKTQQVHSAEFPDGPGKDTFIRVWSKCHSPNNVIANGQNQQGWEDTITKMVGF